MGAFYLIDEPNDERAVRLRDRIELAYTAQGFTSPCRLRIDGLRLGFYGKFCGESTQLYRHSEQGFAAFTGTAIVLGERGAAAAKGLWQLMGQGEGKLEWDRIIGQFCAFHCDGNRLFMFLDPMGIYKAYRRTDGKIIASSFLAVAETVDAPRLNSQAVYEYLFQEATYAGDTVLEQVELVPHGGMHCFELGCGRARTFESFGLVTPREIDNAPMPVHVDACLARLREEFADVAAAFGNDIDTALSGGYDSRLIVALLCESGVSPAVHVYGDVHSADVTVAKSVASAEGIALEHFDKGRFPIITPDAFAAVVEANFRAFDGYPPAGIFDAGADRATRAERASGGRLMLNGGGGEVFRNFFYLREGAFSCRQLVHSFYNRYDPAMTTSRFDEHNYVANLAEKIQTTLGTVTQTLTRLEVERVYPEFRCSYWMGRNNAINNRFGFSLTPFVDPLLHGRTLCVPLAFKNHGRFEARLIEVVSPSMASYLSDYGHAFDQKPPLKRVVKDTATMLRPSWVRRFTYRIRFRKAQQRGRYLQPEYLCQVVDPTLPVMSQYLKFDAVNDPGVWQRAATLEYLAQQLEIKA